MSLYLVKDDDSALASFYNIVERMQSVIRNTWNLGMLASRMDWNQNIEQRIFGSRNRLRFGIGSDSAWVPEERLVFDYTSALNWTESAFRIKYVI